MSHLLRRRIDWRPHVLPNVVGIHVAQGNAFHALEQVAPKEGSRTRRIHYGRGLPNERTAFEHIGHPLQSATRQTSPVGVATASELQHLTGGARAQRRTIAVANGLARRTRYQLLQVHHHGRYGHLQFASACCGGL